MPGVICQTTVALVIVFIACLPSLITGSGAFTEIPVSQGVSVGETAEFRCRHSMADIIRWIVNDSLISRRNDNSDIYSVHTEEDNTDVLTISPFQVDRFNVVCVARFDDPSLTQQNTTVVFLTVDTCSSNDEFTSHPQSIVVNSGGQAQFRCEYPLAEAYIWLVDGVSVTNLLPEDQKNFRISDSKDTLLVQALSEYNMTSVECVAAFASRNNVRSCPVNMTIQGHLDDVKDLKKQNSTLSWKAPFSLNLTNVEPDIAYCVEVYNITCGGRELLISDCDVTETSYTSDVIVPDGYIYEYIVTPRSNVEGAINGTPSQPLRNILPTFMESSTRLSVGNFGQDFKAYQTVLMYTLDEPIPSSYSLSLQSLDGLEDMDHVETTATIEPSVLTLEVVSGLPFRRLWNCTILAYGCQENNILIDVLSTHDFRDIVSSSLHPGEVRVTGSFTDDSTATGVLVIVIGDSEVIYHKASRDGTDKIKETLITGLAGGEYSISVFVVEENGLPFERVATSPKLVAVETNDVVTPPSSSIEYSLRSTSTGVCITCTFLDSSATDCVAVVHQRISQLSSSGLMNIESSHKLTSSGDTASGCIEGVNMEDYQVGVVGGRKISPVTETKVPSQCTNLCWIIVAIAIVLAVSAVAIVITIFICIKQRQRRKQNTSLPKSKDVESPGGSPPARYVPLPKHPKETTPLIKSAGLSPSVPITVEDIYGLLLPVASKWQALGKALSLDEDRLDEISTNNETEEAYLHQMLELYTKRPGWSREEIDEAKKKVEAPPLNETGTTTDHTAILMENSEALSDKHMETSDVESTTETGANDTCEEQSIDSRLSFEVDESHQSGDLDETILTSSESKASTVVSPASTTLQTKDMREQILNFETSTPTGSTTESRNRKSQAPPTFSLSESIDESEGTTANATPLQVQQQNLSGKSIVVHGEQKHQVRFHRRTRSTTFIVAPKNPEEETDVHSEEVPPIHTIEDHKSKREMDKSSDSAYISADVSTLDDRETSVETEDTTADDLTRRKDWLKMMNEQLVRPTHLSSKTSADQFTASSHQLKNVLTSWTPECVGDSTSLYPSSYWPPQQQSSDGDSIVKVAQEGEGPT